MADEKNILVFPAGTEIAFEIHQALRSSKFVKLYGATSVACHANFVFENCVQGVPYVDSPELIDELNKVVDRYNIDYIYPAHDSALLRLTREQHRLHAPVVTSPAETVEICRSKNKTYEFLKTADYLPAVYSCADEVEHYPVFIKPSVGQGSEGARRVDDREELERALAEGVEYAICEYLPGQEFTVDCFTDRHGELRFARARSRDRIRAGISVRSQFMPEDERIDEIARDLNRRFDFNGAWFFQLKENTQGQYRLMEAAPRIAGTMCLARNLGVNFPLLTLYNMWGYDIDILDNNSRLLVDRAFVSRYISDIEYDSVYVDFDDTIVFKGEVNPYLMAFLYQARNKGKRLCLLTKHSGRLNESMEKYGISPALFHEIIWLDKSDNKADHVRGKAIFIDDSFAERKRVKEGCGVSVFDLDMLECLFDWRA